MHLPSNGMLFNIPLPPSEPLNQRDREFVTDSILYSAFRLSEIVDNIADFPNDVASYLNYDSRCPEYLTRQTLLKQELNWALAQIGLAFVLKIQIDIPPPIAFLAAKLKPSQPDTDFSLRSSDLRWLFIAWRPPVAYQDDWWKRPPTDLRPANSENCLNLNHNAQLKHLKKFYSQIDDVTRHLELCQEAQQRKCAKASPTSRDVRMDLNVEPINLLDVFSPWISESVEPKSQRLLNVTNNGPQQSLHSVTHSPQQPLSSAANNPQQFSNAVNKELRPGKLQNHTHILSDCQQLTSRVECNPPSITPNATNLWPNARSRSGPHTLSQGLSDLAPAGSHDKQAGNTKTRELMPPASTHFNAPQEPQRPSPAQAACVTIKPIGTNSHLAPYPTTSVRDVSFSAYPQTAINGNGLGFHHMQYEDPNNPEKSTGWQQPRQPTTADGTKSFDYYGQMTQSMAGYSTTALFNLSDPAGHTQAHFAPVSFVSDETMTESNEQCYNMSLGGYPGGTSGLSNSTLTTQTAEISDIDMQNAYH